MNVPWAERSGRSCVLLPPGESAPGEKGDLHGAGGPLFPTAGVAPIEPCRPMGELRHGHGLRPRAEARAEAGVERGLVEQAVRQRPHVKASSSDYDRLPAAVADLVQPSGGVPCEAAGTI